MRSFRLLGLFVLVVWVATWVPAWSQAVVSCASDDMGYHTCDIGPNGGVTVARQYSETQCIQGQTYGVRGNQVWVDRGCRADFQVLAPGSWNQGSGGVVSCVSDDMGYHTCDIGPNGGVTIVNQRSEARCIEGQTYGVRGNQLWVDRGCRADFQVLAPWRGNQGSGGLVACSSDDMGYHTCDIGPNGGVRVARQHSDAQCIEGQTFGVRGNQLWVNRGCRADFEVLPYRNWNQTGTANVISCSSDDMGRHFCSIPANSRVRLVRQRSDASCAEGQTWGVNENQLWVDRGCRGDFEVRPRRQHGWDNDRDHDRDRDNYGSGPRTVTCSSDDMHRHTCDVGPNSGIRFVRQRSEARCQQNRTYGFSGNQIWVDRGCRADFEVIPRNGRSTR